MEVFEGEHVHAVVGRLVGGGVLLLLVALVFVHVGGGAERHELLSGHLVHLVDGELIRVHLHHGEALGYFVIHDGAVEFVSILGHVAFFLVGVDHF